MQSNKLKQSVAVTGIGSVTASGYGIPAFRNALYTGKSQFAHIPNADISFPLIAALVQSIDLNSIETNLLTLPHNQTEKRHHHLQRMLQKIPLPYQTTIYAALEAWQQSTINLKIVSPRKIGLIVATQNSSSHAQYQLQNEFQKNPHFLSPSYALHFMDTHYVGLLSDLFGIHGEGFTIGAASASGNAALLKAYQLIRDGYLDACMVVGAVADLSPIELQAFYNIGALGGTQFTDSPNQACRPFDNQCDGFIYGQGSGSLILENATLASKRNVPILGYLTGGAMTLDANYLSNPHEQGEMQVMEKAMTQANLTYTDINYINTHGSSSPLGDKTEAAAIETLFKENAKSIFLNSTKSIIGHCLWSAGILEAIATLIQINDRFLHANLNLDDPITNNLSFVKEKTEPFEIKAALNNSFGFGGINSCLVLEPSR